MLPRLNKSKRGKGREREPCPMRGQRERLQLNVWVCLVLTLWRLEGRTHKPRQPWLSVAGSFVLHLTWQGSALRSRRMRILPIIPLLSFPGTSLPACSSVLFPEDHLQAGCC